MTVMRPSGSWVTMWSRLAEAVSEAFGSIASGRSPLHALCTSLRRTSTCACRGTFSLTGLMDNPLHITTGDTRRGQPGTGLQAAKSIKAHSLQT